MIDRLKIKIFADGANLEGILALTKDARISGYTTNPTLMRQAGITDYEGFARELLGHVTSAPISFEVFADEPEEIDRQARTIATWGDNVYVKIPVTTTDGTSLVDLAGRLSNDGVKVNVTAMFTVRQVELVTQAVESGAASYQSIFAGRIADAGVDPLPIMRESLAIMSSAPRSECIWASPREVLNLIQADSIGCHIITMTHDLLRKLDGLGKDLDQFSLETVQMFHRDATAAGYKL